MKISASFLLALSLVASSVAALPVLTECDSSDSIDSGASEEVNNLFKLYLKFAKCEAAMKGNDVVERVTEY
ncbi:hypothetical protein NLI96_g9448 [Meripilus lineatus]|uniref:Uncharacterized protein n=1 Tax=Meripilus lineatus TaxID=2056292 RepID=A0AAD5V013_9APHY|nr:hypothetical protein NLI96_g9448 [Physisporinus lineatus]